MNKLFSLRVSGKNQNNISSLILDTKEERAEQPFDQMFKSSSKAFISSRNISNSTRDEKNYVDKDVNKLAHKSTPNPPVHRLDFLTITIPFIFLFSVTVVIFLLNLFKTSLLTSSIPGPSYRYTPDIHIIEPTISVADREVLDISEKENHSAGRVIYLIPFCNTK